MTLSFLGGANTYLAPPFCIPTIGIYYAQIVSLSSELRGTTNRGGSMIINLDEAAERLSPLQQQEVLSDLNRQRTWEANGCQSWLPTWVDLLVYYCTKQPTSTAPPNSTLPRAA